MWGLTGIPADSRRVPLTPGPRLCEQLAGADFFAGREHTHKALFLWNPISAPLRARVATFQGRRKA